MHAAKDDDLGARLGRLARQPERVTDEIGDVLNFRPLVVVGEHHRVPNAGELANPRVELRNFGGALQRKGRGCHAKKLAGRRAPCGKASGYIRKRYDAFTKNASSVRL